MIRDIPTWPEQDDFVPHTAYPTCNCVVSESLSQLDNVGPATCGAAHDLS